jgi:D-xylose transport system substrate-binding protein
MKIVKKMMLTCITGVLLINLFLGCSKKETVDTQVSGVKDIKDIKVGVSIGETAEERWDRETVMFREYAVAKGFELLFQSAESNAQRQISQCENLINQGIDVLILQALDGYAATPIIDLAHEEGVKVIAYDRLIMNSDLDYYITHDSFKVGALQAKFVLDRVSKGNFIWLKGSADNFNAHLVANGVRSVVQPYIDRGDVNIVLEQWCRGWDPNEALKHTENALTMVANNIQGVFAPNDNTAGGAIQALAAQGLNVPIAGQDADLAACQRIVEGRQTGTVYKPIESLNTSAMDLAVAIATGKDVKTALAPNTGTWVTYNNELKEVDAFTIDIIPIDQSNLYDILIVRDKFHKLEDVYRNVPRDRWPDQ